MITPSPADYDATLTRTFARANRAGDALDAPDPPAPPEPTFTRAQRQADPRGAVDAPEWVRPPTFTDDKGEVHDITDLEGVLQSIVNGAELEAQALWYQCDIASWLWSQTTNRAERRKLLGELAATIGKDTRTVRRRIAMGMTFPVELRRNDRPAALYLLALTTEDPIYTIMECIARGWGTDDLQQRIEKKASPVVKTALADETYAPQSSQEDPEEAAKLVMELWAAARARGATAFRLRVDMETPAEAA